MNSPFFFARNAFFLTPEERTGKAFFPFFLTVLFIGREEERGRGRG
jgi:hypothetical protein